MRHHLFAVIIALGAFGPLAACQTDVAGGGANGGTGAGADSAAACEARGGRWSRGGLFPDPLCFVQTPDAGKSCAKASDCVGICLADSRTCSLESPMFGCYSFLDDDGVEATLCAD